jgi:hypothetical protein
MSLMLEQARVADRWAKWASDEVEAWPDTVTPDVEWSLQTIRRAVDGEPLSDAT